SPGLQVTQQVPAPTRRLLGPHTAPRRRSARTGLQVDNQMTIHATDPVVTDHEPFTAATHVSADRPPTQPQTMQTQLITGPQAVDPLVLAHAPGQWAERIQPCALDQRRQFLRPASLAAEVRFRTSRRKALTIGGFGRLALRTVLPTAPGLGISQAHCH